MKVKVEKLDGSFLDFAVAMALNEFRIGTPGVQGLKWGVPVLNLDADETFAPSSNWRDGGPIIEREHICVVRMGGGKGFWQAGFSPRVSNGQMCDSGWLEMPEIEMTHESTGAKPLVAAMRAFVKSKLGDEVKLP